MKVPEILLLVAPLVSSAFGQSHQYAYANGIEPSIPNGHWIQTWSAMPQLTEYTNLPNSPFNQSGLEFFNSTIRQTVHISLGADQIRLRISNELSPIYLNITSVTVALPGGNGSAGQSLIVPETLQTVTFSGEESVAIPDGAQVVSDPLNFTVGTSSIMTISMYLAAGQLTNYITSHPGSRTNVYYTFGNQVSATNITGPDVQSVAHWYFISAVEAWLPKDKCTWVIVGDSITDGRGSDTDRNNRWPDLVFAKMQGNANTSDIAYSNQGAGGNRVLDDGNGPNALSRITRDVLAQSGVRYVMIFEGVNDIGTANNDTLSQAIIGKQLISSYQQIIARVHAFGIPVFASTITPFSAPNNTIQPYSDPLREATRQKVNTWIRESGKFDAIVDFDAVVRDSKTPSMLNPAYNSGDFLHPNVLGYQAIADAFPLELFTQFAGGVSYW